MTAAIFGVERIDVTGDLFETPAALPLEQRDGKVLGAVLERGAIAYQAVACVDELRQLVLLRTSSWPDRRLQRGSHPGEQPGIDAIGLGERARCLGEAPRPLRVQLDAGQIAERDRRSSPCGRWPRWGTDDRSRQDGHDSPGPLWKYRCRWFVVGRCSFFPLSHACHPGLAAPVSVRA
jgi:hypothetical protein